MISPSSSAVAAPPFLPSGLLISTFFSLFLEIPSPSSLRSSPLPVPPFFAVGLPCSDLSSPTTPSPFFSSKLPAVRLPRLPSSLAPAKQELAPLFSSPSHGNTVSSLPSPRCPHQSFSLVSGIDLLRRSRLPPPISSLTLRFLLRDAVAGSPSPFPLLSLSSSRFHHFLFLVRLRSLDLRRPSAASLLRGCHRPFSSSPSSSAAAKSAATVASLLLFGSPSSAHLLPP